MNLGLGLPDVVVQDVRVVAHGGLDVGVPQRLLDPGRIAGLAQEPRRHRVAQVMPPDAGDGRQDFSGLGAIALPPRRQRFDRDRVALALLESVAVPGPALAALLATRDIREDVFGMVPCRDDLGEQRHLKRSECLGFPADEPRWVAPMALALECHLCVAQIDPAAFQRAETGFADATQKREREDVVEVLA
ncbi:MAG TPA: hypothetical protein VKP67_12900 [Xanthobacteraceae bacterium]|nr:hypothetical protein [Xanthobacteraceae bacterium]